MRTDFLFAQPSFLTGIGSIFDLGGALFEYNDMPTPEEADGLALAMDWEMIGQDFRGAIEAFLQEHPELRAAA